MNGNLKVCRACNKSKGLSNFLKLGGRFVSDCTDCVNEEYEKMKSSDLNYYKNKSKDNRRILPTYALPIKHRPTD